MVPRGGLNTQEDTYITSTPITIFCDLGIYVGWSGQDFDFF